MKKRGVLAGVLAVAAALFLLFVGWRCPIKLLTGIPCPACGLSRATRLVLHGDFAAATRMHPLVWLAVPVTALMIGAELVGYARTAQWGASMRSKSIKTLMLITSSLMFGLWIARFAGLFGGPDI